MALTVSAHDIIGHLCSFIHEYADDSDQWCTLPALARTCRAFFEPAIAAIWHDLPSLVILAYILPPDACEIDATKSGWDDDCTERVVRSLARSS